MKIVVDTNVFISGLLWGGPPNRTLRWTRDRFLKIIVCEEITAEVRRVMQYKKFSKRFSDLDTTSNKVFSYFMNLITFMPTPQIIPEVIHEDRFDNIFLALASENKARLIVSGDKHLLDLKVYKNIEIVMPGEASMVIETLLT